MFVRHNLNTLTFMKLFSIFSLWAFLFCLPLQTFGQKTTLSNAHLVKTYKAYKNPDPNLSHQNYFDAMAGKMGLSAQSKMVLTEESEGKNGYTHFKYQQMHAGLPVFGSRYILHEKAGKVMTATGHFSPKANVTSIPGFNATTAIAFAKKDMKATAYDTKATEPVLCFFDPAFPNVSETLRLAYQVDLHSTEPFDKRRYFVDAATGKIIKKLPLILHQGVPSTAKTNYYGVQNIITDSIAPQEFVLRDPTRGEGIFIYNNDQTNFTSNSSNWDLTNPQKDEVALDAHYCTQEYYDMMLADYNWQGQDGQGKALKVIVHAGAFVNAYWDGEASSFGDGDCVYGPLTTLEVVGHEFTHGMIDYTSQLVYDAESGAINESLADMFGKMLERKTDPANSSWDLGHSFILTPDGEPFRVMDDPASVQMPAFYKGQFWQDNNGVHTNSSIGNLWFSMLVDGKQGTNEAGVAFNVPALGVDKSGQIVFEVNKNYFTENSDYNAFFEYSTEVAESLYGPGSTELLAVTEAWKAVGLPNVLTIGFDLGIVSEFSYNDIVCGLDEYIPVNFKIVNLSGTAYDPSMNATLTLSYASFPDYTVDLTSPIGPGEVFEILVTDWLKATQPGYLFFSATLNIADDNADNNYSQYFYEVAAFGSNDLGLDVYFEQQGCFASNQGVFMFVSNNSCEKILAGTTLQFTATDNIGNLAWSSPYTLVEDLSGAGYLFIFFEVPVTSSPLILTLVYPNDPNPINNQVESPNQSTLPITSTYLNTFSFLNGLDGYLEIVQSGPNPTMLYQNNRYFGATGLATNPDEFQRCPDPLNVFNNEYANGINASLRTCIDFSFSPAPTLEFDLVQFRNTFAEPSNYLYSSMLQAKWAGNGTGTEVIFGQPEGEVQHHNIALPPFFKGELNLKFYAEVGKWELFPNYLAEDDFVLLGNLKLSAPTSGTEELAIGSSILISPNPARELATIQAADGIKSLILQNLNGQTLRTLQVNATTYDLDLKGLANGFYLLNIQLEHGQWGVRKLVKMD